MAIHIPNEVLGEHSKADSCVKVSLIPAARYKKPLQLRQHDPTLLLVFSGFVFVAGFARLVALEEEDLAEAFIGIDFGRQRRGIGDFQSDEPFPFGFKWRD